MSKESESAYRQGYQAAEKFYQAQIGKMQTEINQLNRSKGAAKFIIKALRAQAGG